MVQSTDNHGLDDYEPGDPPKWDHSDTVTRVEERLALYRSLDGPRADQTPHSGALFVDDTVTPPILYRGDDGTWTQLGTLATRRTITLADGAKDVLLGTDSITGKVTVIDATNDELAEYFLRGSNAEAQLFVETATQFAETEGNAGTINAYWDSGNNRYEIENQTGATVELTITDTRS